MRHLADTLARLDAKRAVVLAELHPALDAKVRAVLADLDGRLTPYCGYRGPAEQAQALAEGTSEAAFGESPHNFKPALACDVVLDPRHVAVRAHPKDADYPDLWDDASPEAVAAWAALEEAAKAHGLERVNLSSGNRDRPHLQLPGWRALTG